METMRDLLSAQPFLAEPSPAYLDKLVPWAKKSVSPLRTQIFEEGQQAQRFWLIREGASPSKPRVQPPGRGCGEPWPRRGAWLVVAVPPYRWHFSASAGEVMSVIEFDAAGVRELAGCPVQSEPSAIDVAARLLDEPAGVYRSESLGLLADELSALLDSRFGELG
jgi:hypothetical protein